MASRMIFGFGVNNDDAVLGGFEEALVTDLFDLAAFGGVFDGEEHAAVFGIGARETAGVEVHGAAADMRKVVLDDEVLKRLVAEESRAD